AVLGAGDLPLDQVEQRAHQLADALARERAPVHRLEVGDEPALPLGVEEGEPVRELVPPDLLHETEARVDELEDRAVDLGDLAAQGREHGVVLGSAHSSAASRPAGYDPNTCRCRVRARISASASRTIGSRGCPASTASKRYRQGVFGIGRETSWCRSMRWRPNGSMAR